MNGIFLQSSALDLGIAIVTVVVFAGLTAWDTQKLKEMYHPRDTEDAQSRQAIFGALSLYLDFLNLMLAFLRIFGVKND